MKTIHGVFLPHRDEALAPLHLSPVKHRGGKYKKMMGYRGGDHMNTAACASERSADRRHISVTLPKLKFMGEI